MKRFRSIITLVLAALMIITLASCAKSVQNTIVGSWKGTIDLTDRVLDYLGDDGDSDTSSLGKVTVDVLVKLTSDGGINISYDSANLIEGIKPYIKKYTENYLKASAERSGVDPETVISALGYESIDDYVNHLINGVTGENLFGEDISISGKYKIENDKLFFAEDDFTDVDYVVFTIDGDSMVWSESGKPKSDFATMLPITFERSE
ncbi:MAG: hypothetical protein IJT91_00300 [Clostridia bacterium]|nr:hypothetical protein [Clostridia bacterium]